MPKAYLTIDDSPSPHTAKLCDSLKARIVPAILFCRGDRIKEYGINDLIHAVQNGFILGNHNYSHRRASQMNIAEIKDEIIKTDELIDDVYQQANTARPGKYFRFPHMDRGCGGWIVDYDAVDAQTRQIFIDGLNLSLDPPSQKDIEKKEALQNFLVDQGFEKLPTSQVTYNWFVNSEIGTSIDAMYTYSTADWMVTARHKGKWPYASIDDLQQKIDNDPFLLSGDSANIVLAHDDQELYDVCLELIDYMRARDVEFLHFK